MKDVDQQVFLTVLLQVLAVLLVLILDQVPFETSCDPFLHLDVNTSRFSIRDDKMRVSSKSSISRLEFHHDIPGDEEKKMHSKRMKDKEGRFRNSD